MTWVLRSKIRETTNQSKVVDVFARLALEESKSKPWELNKTKAHRTREQSASDGDPPQYMGNAMADEEAERVNFRYGPTDDQDLQPYLRAKKGTLPDGRPFVLCYACWLPHLGHQVQVGLRLRTREKQNCSGLFQAKQASHFQERHRDLPWRVA